MQAKPQAGIAPAAALAKKKRHPSSPPIKLPNSGQLTLSMQWQVQRMMALLGWLNYGGNPLDCDLALVLRAGDGRVLDILDFRLPILYDTALRHQGNQRSQPSTLMGEEKIFLQLDKLPDNIARMDVMARCAATAWHMLNRLEIQFLHEQQMVARRLMPLGLHQAWLFAAECRRETDSWQLHWRGQGVAAVNLAPATIKGDDAS